MVTSQKKKKSIKKTKKQIKIDGIRQVQIKKYQSGVKSRIKAKRQLDKEYIESKIQSGLQVHCPVCGLVQFETTIKYDADKLAHPGMITMLEPFLSNMWEHPPPDDTAGYASLICGECGSLLAPDGKLKVISKKGKA